MLTNLRQGLSLNMFKKALGNSPEVEARYQQFHPQDPTELVGNTDFFVFDATLQSEKGYIAQSLQDLVAAMLSNPQTAMMLSIDPSKIIKEILQLRGVNNLERFNYDQPPADPTLLAQLHQLQQGGANPNAPGAGGVAQLPSLPPSV